MFEVLCFEASYCHHWELNSGRVHTLPSKKQTKKGEKVSVSIFFFFLTANPCPVPFVIPENAVLSEKEFYVDQNVSIKCREGFLLQGQSSITCSPDETWTQTSAKCESKWARGSQ